MLRRQPFWENGGEWISTARVPDEGGCYKSIIFGNLWHSLAMFTTLAVEIEKIVCIELIQKFDVS